MKPGARSAPGDHRRGPTASVRNATWNTHINNEQIFESQISQFYYLALYIYIMPAEGLDTLTRGGIVFHEQPDTDSE